MKTSRTTPSGLFFTETAAWRSFYTVEVTDEFVAAADSMSDQLELMLDLVTRDQKPVETIKCQMYRHDPADDPLAGSTKDVIARHGRCLFEDRIQPDEIGDLLKAAQKAEKEFGQVRFAAGSDYLLFALGWLRL